VFGFIGQLSDLLELGVLALDALALLNEARAVFFVVPITPHVVALAV
jgi:hypothetical protein